MVTFDLEVRSEPEGFSGRRFLKEYLRLDHFERLFRAASLGFSVPASSLDGQHGV
jgi:hypothetical protein